MPKTSTRKERRRELRANYLSWHGRMSYIHGPTLNSSLEEDEPQPGQSGAGPSGAGPSGVSSRGVCVKCRPILSRYSD